MCILFITCVCVRERERQREILTNFERQYQDENLNEGEKDLEMQISRENVLDFFLIKICNRRLRASVYAYM